MVSHRNETHLTRDEARQLRQTFNGDPAVYDRGRRGYPPELFADILQRINKPSLKDVKVMEIAPGTGQATKSLLELDAVVTAVELGDRLADFLRHKFATNRNLEVITGAFEEVELPRHEFDLAVCATAWHWLDKEVRFRKAQQLLRPGGTLGIISTNQVASLADHGFFERVNTIYQKWGTREKSVINGEPTGDDARMVDSQLFEGVVMHRYNWDQPYTTGQYVDLVRSYSGTLAMDVDAREGFLEEMRQLIDGEFGGSVTRPLVITLTLGTTIS